MPQTIALDRTLRPALPTVLGNVDYTEFERLLRRMDELLRASGVERQVVEWSEAKLQAEHARNKQGGTPSAAKIKRTHFRALQALRTMILKRMLGEDFRGLSRRLAECALFRWFCELDELVVKVPSKSALERYEKLLPAEQLRAIIDRLTRAAAGAESQEVPPLRLANAVELDVFFLDSTCVQANVHFPVDWVLLRDAARTLIKAVILIRRHGLKHRMPEPSAFLRRMNRLAIEMTHARRTTDSRKARKRALRGMKTLLGIIARHARRYHRLLETRWTETDWSEGQAAQVLRRIAGVLEKLPAAIQQAHERIIGGRQVPNGKKRLSLYEDDLHVIVRGKAGAEVEFGNTLLLTEQSDGLIVDFEFLREHAPAEAKLLPRSLDRLEKLTGKTPLAMATDRGFDSAANRQLLEEKDIINGLCPKAPAELKKRLGDEIFHGLQQRRAQTEGRIGIFKQKMLGGLLRAKGYAHRAMAIHWAVLVHNLWVLARLPQAAAQAPPMAAAA